eukprot:TRINITY_DN3059_c1_g1_i1.p1 TRINITY_DN3059_c1_g1~~TRINITY_DN3059_c1_g1_i1.p1  ORF type:complete len:210 (+),score=70.18 TRINITY_DN3059_c1_g1_i1:87-632(+)
MGELSFGVPSGQVEVVEAPQLAVDGHAPAAEKKGAGGHVRRQRLTPEEKRAKGMKYLEDKGVMLFLDTMLNELMRELPEDPVDWCTAYLFRHESMTVIQARANVRRKSMPGFPEAARAWSAEWKVPFLFDDLLGDMITEEPAEPDRYAASWFRWNKKKFMVTHHKDAPPKKLPKDWQPIDI